MTTLTVVIAGPMSDLPASNTPAFNEAASRLGALGYTVLNPTRHARPYRTWLEYVHLGLADLEQADLVAVLDGWQFSAGARILTEAATKLEKDVLPLHLIDPAALAAAA